MRTRIIATLVGLIMVAGTSMAYASINTNAFSDLTGPFSSNNNLIDAAGIIDFSFDNMIDSVRNIATAINTGNNDLSNNTSVFGDCTGTVAISILPNNVISGWNNGSWLMPYNTGLDQTFFSGANSLTGPNSVNVNEVNASNLTDIDLFNNINAIDNIALDINTGNNSTAFNTTVGGVGSGSVIASIGLQNAGVGFGLPVINLGNAGLNDGIGASFGNSTTGPNSINENILNASSAFDANIVNQNSIVNNVSVNANTGNNDVCANTLVGNVASGNVQISLSSAYGF